MRLRAKAGSRFDSSSAKGSPAAVANALVSSRRKGEERADRRGPIAWPIPKERAGSRRLREPIDDGLGHVGTAYDQWRSRSPRTGSRRRSAACVAGRSGGRLEVPAREVALRRVRREVDPKRGAETPCAGCSSEFARVAKSVVDVERVDALGANVSARAPRRRRPNRRRPRPSPLPSEVESTRPDASAASFSLSSAFPFVTHRSYAGVSVESCWTSRKLR